METPKFAPTSPKAIVFDLDDTLYDYHAPHRAGLDAAWQAWTSIFGDCTIETFDRLFKVARNEVIHRLGNSPSSHNRLLGFVLLAQQHSKLGADAFQIAGQLDAAYWKAFLSTIQLAEGVDELILWCREHEVKIGILSDGLTHLQLRKLQALSLFGRFDELVTSEEVGTEKPDPKGFDVLLGKLGTMAKDTWIIGDNLAKDIAVAQARGALGILCKQGVYSATDQGAQSPLTAHVMNFREILAWLRKTQT